MIAVFVAVALVSPLSAAQESVTLRRIFREGEREQFETTLSSTTPLGEVVVKLRTELRVKRVFGNGGAELETELLQVETRINGEPMDVPREAGSRIVAFRVDGTGMPFGLGEPGGFGFASLQFAGIVGSKPLVVGKKTPFEWVDQANKKQRASGEVTLLDVAAGIAKLASKWEIRGGASGKSLKIDMTSFVEVSTGKLVKAVGSIVEPPSKDADRKSTRFSTERDASHS